MSKKITITAGNVRMEAELNDGKVAEAIWDALPIQERGSTWGDEIYFSIPVNASLEDGQEVVEPGDLGYWPPGNAFCIFYGRTPASHGNEIRPASAVEVVGRLLGEPTDFKKVRGGATVLIEASEG